MARSLTAHGVLFVCSLLALISVVSAKFSPTSKSNVAVYYGQGPNQQRVSVYCNDDSIDIIILAFVDIFPAQGNGYPGINFGNQCSGSSYPGPGYNGQNNPGQNNLLICPNLQQDLQTCKANGKTVLLSLGGGVGGYGVNGATDGVNFANLLWSMFGPQQQAWIKAGKPRPFDYNGAEFSVSGFDLDIEAPPQDNSVGYNAFIKQLKALYATAPGRTFYLTGAPQCVVPDANMGGMISAAAFDMLFIQFYNTPYCSARTWANNNPNYKPGGAVNTGSFTYDTWTSWLANTPSRNAMLYIGIPASASAANAGNDLSLAQTSNIANAYYCRSNFGGMSIWEATYASQNVANGKNFYQNVKAILNAIPAGQSCAGQSASTVKTTMTTLKTTTTPASQPTSQGGLPVSNDGSCGPSVGKMCGSGNCCSQWGYCGSGDAYCGTGCQKGYGTCH